jgi:hypothetical protein
MRYLLKSVAKTILVAALFVTGRASAFGEELPLSAQPDASLFKWDLMHNVLIFYRDGRDLVTPSVRTYRNGTEAGLNAFVLREFPEAREIDVWNVAATPDGGVALLCVLQLGQRRVQHVLLTYDAWGMLRKVWDMHPYHHHQIAVDANSNVYAFGHRLDRGDEPAEPDYPLLVKYSPDGKVLRELLPRSRFPAGMDVVGTNSSTGEHQLLVVRNSLVLYVAGTKELFWFDLSGELQQRLPLSSVLNQMAADTGSAWVEILCLAVKSNGEVLAQIRLWPRDGSSESIRFAMVRIAADTSSWEGLSPTTRAPQPGWFLGLNREGKLLFLNARPNGELFLDRYDRVP